MGLQTQSRTMSASLKRVQWLGFIAALFLVFTAGTALAGPTSTAQKAYQKFVEKRVKAEKKMQSYWADRAKALKCPRYRKCNKGFKFLRWAVIDVTRSFTDMKNGACSSGKDPLCAKAATEMKQFTKAVITLVFEIMDKPTVMPWDISSDFATFADDPYFGPLLDKKKVDEAFYKLGKRKAAYFVKQLARYKGNSAKYAKANNTGKCSASRSKKISNKSSKLIHYAFGPKDTIWIRCVLPKARKGYKGKSKKDYLSLYMKAPGSYWPGPAIKAKIKWKGNTVLFKVPLKNLRLYLKNRGKNLATVVHGRSPWTVINMDIKHKWVKGKGWAKRGGKRVWTDIWAHNALGGTNVYWKFRN